MKKFTHVLAGASMLAIAGGVSAEPVTLSASQMDGVSAGAVVLLQGAAVSDAAAAALSNLLGETVSATAVNVDPLAGIVVSAGESAAVAVSSFAIGSPVNGAQAASASQSAATLF
ncbi:MAG: hypothetical protein JXK16_03205 [Thiotrichales bacterium]|nr:hypothetical protein [Thiotrichales bacterium]